MVGQTERKRESDEKERVFFFLHIINSFNWDTPH